MCNRSVATLAILAALVVPASRAGATNYGRLTQRNEIVSTEITPEGDEDDYVFEGGAGFLLKAQVKRKSGDLLPLLDLVAPDGTVEATGKAGKTSAKIAKAVLAEGGRYALRIRGASGTGGYELKWSLKPAKVAPVKNRVFAADTTEELPFEAIGGALVSWSLKYKGNGGAGVVGILDPDGTPVDYDPDLFVVSKGFTQKGSSIPIPADRPGGAYALVVRNDFSEDSISVSIKVVLPKLAAAPVSLTSAEPTLIAVNPTQGGFGVPVTLAGTNLSDTPLGVTFGGAAGTEAAGTGGTSVSVKPPAGSGTVDVILANADGQVAVLLASFSYYPPPTASSFSPPDGPAGGGWTMTITGSGYRIAETGLYRVRVGSSDASQVMVVNDTTITCSTPVGVAGPTSVRLFDVYGQSVLVPGTYNMKAAPTIVTASPSACPVGTAGVMMIITGQNLRGDDLVYLSSSPDPIPATLVLNPIDGSIIGHRISIPLQATPGKVDVSVRDVYGQTAIRVNGLSYYDFFDATTDADGSGGGTAPAIPAVTGVEDFGGVSSAGIDRDANGTLDWLLVTHTSGVGGGPGTRLLVNDGTGVFADQTSTKMPAAAGAEDFAGNRVVVGKMSGDAVPDAYLSRPGTGASAAVTNTPYTSWDVIPFGRLLFPDGTGVFSSQTINGTGTKFSIGFVKHCAFSGGAKCNLFDYDFRSVGAAAGDLDGDGDSDVVLVNDVSINSYKGSGTYAVYIGCGSTGYGAGGRICFSGQTTYTFGSAMRICTMASNGALTDNTKTILTTAWTVNEDFRAVAAAIGDMNADFLNDIVITWNDGLTGASGNPLPATRVFKQSNSGLSVTFGLLNQFLPVPSGTSDDDWRGDAVGVGDLNTDFVRDMVISLNGPVLSGAKFSTRVLFNDPNTNKLVDKTAEILGTPGGTQLLPAGDDARAKFVIVQDLDKDGDPDILLSTPDDVGGNRRTRFLLNVGAGSFIDASSIFPAYGADNGAALSVVVADVDGDGDNDLLLTDATEFAGAGRKTRLWKQRR